MDKQLKNKIVYGWYHNEEVFYIGIGSIKRSTSKRGRNAYCSRKRTKAEREGTFEVRIIGMDLTWKEACLKEIELIKQYGRIDLGTGILTNMTSGGDGGDGALGHRHTEQTRRKMSKSHTGKKLSKSHKQKLRVAAKLGWTDERKAKLSKAHRDGKYDHVKNIVRKTGESNKRGKHPRAKPVQTPLGIFECGADAAEAHEISKMKLSRRIKSDQFPNYKFLGQN